VNVFQGHQLFQFSVADSNPYDRSRLIRWWNADKIDIGSVARPLRITCSYFCHHFLFLGFWIEQHQLLAALCEGKDVAAIRRSSWRPQMLRAWHPRNDVSTQVDRLEVDCGPA
jgi:hypothetical protein